MELSEGFKKYNKITFQYATQIEEYFKGWGILFISVIVSINSINLKLKKQYKRNSLLVIINRGCAKSQILLNVLAKNNPKSFTILPSKMFESELVKKPKEYFHNKILVHDDLITAFGGLSVKQRMQLVSFFTELLSDGKYSRDQHKLEGIDTLCICGMALENYREYHKELFDSTFLDRFITTSKRISRNDKELILEHVSSLKERAVEIPKVKVKVGKRKVEVKLNFDKAIRKEIDKLAMELDDYGIMSSVRAQNYIDVFCMSNALLNDRKQVLACDLELYKMIHKFNLASDLRAISIKKKIKQSFAKKPRLSDVDRLEKLNIPKTTYYRLKKKLKQGGEI